MSEIRVLDTVNVPSTVVSQRLTLQRLTHFTRFLEILKKLIILYFGNTKLPVLVFERIEQRGKT